MTGRWWFTGQRGHALRAWVRAFAGMTGMIGIDGGKIANAALAQPAQPFPISPSETPAPYNALPFPITDPA